MTLDPSGRYRPLRSSTWATFGPPLTPNARLVFLALMTGASSNLAGIAFLGRETLVRETALGHAELESALLELEKSPTPARSFIVRDDLVIWLRDSLRDAPGVLDARRRFASDRHRTGVRTILGSLPATSVVVQKFKRTYRLAIHTPYEGVGQGASKVRRRRSEDRFGYGKGDARGKTQQLCICLSRFEEQRRHQQHQHPGQTLS